jgi:hypothetical protein
VAQKQETTVEVFEVDALAGIVEKVVHAQMLEFFSRTIITWQKGSRLGLFGPCTVPVEGMS